MSVASSAVSSPERVTFHQASMIQLVGLSDEMRAAIITALTIPNPTYTSMRRFSGWVPSNVPKMLHGYVETRDAMFVPPGFGWEAWKIVQSLGGNPAFEPDGFTFPHASISLVYSGETRPYQTRALRDIGSIRHATVEMPCGSGKTDVAVRLICDRDVPALVLVHTIDLMRQWVSRFETRTGYSPATYGGRARSKKRQLTGAEPVIVCTVQSLRRSAEMIEMMRLTRELVILDEAHHTPATTFTDVLAQLQPRYRYGFTATKERADGLTKMIDWWIGPTRARVGRAELEESGAILRADLVVYRTTFEHEFKLDDTGEYTAMLTKLYDDEERRESVPMWIYQDITKGLPSTRTHLVISGSIEYGEWIKTSLAGMWGIESETLNGKMKKADREAVLERVKSGATRVVIASTVADEGLDMPGLTDVWLVTPTRSAAKIEQRVGRILRPAPGKPKPRIHDIVDPNVRALMRNQRTGELVLTRTLLNQFKNRVHTVYKHTVDRGLDEAFALIREWRAR